ncbi:MAG: hypothetical protein V2I67_20245 [Thermoanaerobaculales bacterium]|jgi:hypothetical protein|nr:hypothetical protein [Thermoanaerobaculales bacterium]
MTSTASSPSSLRTAAAVFIARVAIPLWFFIGAVLKLIDGSPSNLPVALVKWLGALGMDLRFVLEFSIAVELIVVGAMVMLPSLSRWIGIVILAVFMPILFGDVAMGASSCGCFGAVEMPPWITLSTDVIFLLCLIFLARGVDSLKLSRTLPTWRVVAVTMWSLVSVAVAFGLTAGGTSEAVAEEKAAVVASSGPAEGYYLPEYDAWIGQPFTELDLASWIRDLPEDLDRGQQYLLFYRLDCEHCHELMEVFFAEEVPLPTTAVAIPERDGFPSERVQPFVCGECRQAELPTGIDWFFATPVLVRLAEGIVQCAAEVTAETPTCLEAY